ncbi:tyrosine-type recombinase/integrase [Prevotella histicola]|uniref:tyrosine-type recombinase/integrase n=1 Tax=Prevotella histicola TaxID=470565 RepID=UPI001C5FC89E|nr:tyrosine-type recombinase/integrase [Prevotella histicola]MBW4757688.1 tyrosine-type recombinase/integrase [Prevotella histicola]
MELNQLISVNFNLRKPKSSTPTPLYMVVYYVDDKGMKVQAKIPTGKKVHPSLWDSKRQQPIMINKGIDLTTNQLSEQAEVTAYITNCRILVYSEKNLNFDEIKEKINLKENNEMSPVTQQFISAKKTPKATKAMEVVLNSINESNKSENTKYAYRKNYNKWCEWLRDTKQVDSMKALSQLKFNEFKKWLVASGATNAMVNDTCGYIVRIIKEIVNGEGAIYGVKEVTFKKLATTSTNVKCELLEEEIEALKDTKTISEREEFYKNVFLLQLATGQRISDTYTIIKGEYDVLKDDNGNEFIIIKNKKSTRGAKVKKSYIPMTKEVSDLLQVLQGNELIPTNDKTLTEYVNIEIKEIARRAGLNRITPNGNPLYSEISSHYARHTVTTQLSRKGLTSEQIALQLGNSKEMVERVYKHETDSDIIAKLQPAAANTPAPQVQAPAQPAVAKDKDLEYYNNLSDDDKLLYTKKLNDYNVLKDDFFKSLERQPERKRKAAAEAKTREIVQVWGFEGANDMEYKKLCFFLDLIKQDINDLILTYKVYNDEAPQGGMISAINDYERLLINIGKLTYYCHL